ncbi:MAG: hypothetical protein JWR02_2314 [Mucilaginibacter sp.]|nr:hypothetical protein [Mucilaginibacter sp.]
MTLHFFIDKEHFPYQYKDDLSFKNKKLVELLGSSNTWMLWTLRTYLELKPHYACTLTDTIPASGITFFFRGSINLAQKPNLHQFWVCMVADSVWHPYSQINLFQNYLASTKYPQSYFVRHWPQLNIIKSLSSVSFPKNIFYFGEVANLAPELKSADWKNFIATNDFAFKTPHFSQWNDYSDADIIIGIRSFDPDDQYINKPASKLINSWLANAVFIGGKDLAYSYERETEFDYIDVKSYDDLKEVLIKLKTDTDLFSRYRLQAVNRGNDFSERFFLNQWVTLIDQKILPLCQHSGNNNKLKHYIFLLRRYLIFKLESTTLRLKKIFQI